MKKYVFLTCDDLSDYVVDDELALESFKKICPEDSLDVISWSNESVNWSDYDYAVIRTTWDYTKRLEEFLNVLESIKESGCKLLNSSSIVKWNSRKTYLKDLSKSGIKVIESIFLEDEDLESFKDKLINLPLVKMVIKPVVGASAEKIEILSKAEMIDKFESLEKKEDWFVQPFIEEVLEGEISYLFFNNELSHVVKKVPKKGDFRVQEEYGSALSQYTPNEEELNEAQRVVDSIGEKLLYARVDMLKTKEGQRLIELELVEPSLYFRIDPPSSDRFIHALKNI